MESFLKEHPQLSEIYYSQEAGDIIVMSEETSDIFNNFFEQFNSDVDLDIGIVESINKISNSRKSYFGPYIPVDLIYNGEVILKVETGGD